MDDFYQGAVPALLPFFAAERNYTGLAAGGLTFAATFLSSAVQPVFGWTSDRRRIRWMIGLGMLVAGIGVGLSGLVNSYPVTWIFIMLTGLGVAAYHPEATRTAREFGGQSAQSMSWFSVGGNAGIAIAPLVVTPILAVTGLRGTPLLTIPAVLMALVLAAVSRGRPAGTGTTSQHAEQSQRTDDWKLMGWLSGIIVLRSTAYLGMATFLALYLVHHFGVSAGAAEPALTVFTGTGACGTVLGGWLADRWGRLPTLRLGYAVGTVGLAVVALGTTLPVVYVGCVLSGVGLYLPFAIHIMLGQDYLPNRLATASGITTGLSISAGGLFAPLLGILADADGQQAALLVLIALPVIALVLSLRLHNRIGQRSTPVPARHS